MKAQLSVEYYVSLTIFILFVGYIFFQLILRSPQFITEVENERLRSESYQVSELLINDPGQPIDWNQANVKRIGLSSNLNMTNLLSIEKISSLQSICNSDYEKIRKSLGTEYFISIDLVNMTSGEKLIACTSPISVTKKTKISITRIVALDSKNFGELTLQMW
jgi:hypothetical protein